MNRKDKKTLNGFTIRVRCEDERIFQRLFYRLWNSRTLHTSMLFVCCQRSVRGDCQKISNLASHAYIDRKSTRLNSSHVAISYAVFCLKKKNNEYIAAKM